MPDFDGWETFYLIVGGAAGALVGLQFVVLTLIAENPQPRAADAGPVFVTPTIVHFAAVLLLSAILRAPWQGIEIPAIICALIGLGGIGYAVSIAIRMHRQLGYRPDWDDWLFYFLAPGAGYAALAGISLLASKHPEEAMFGYSGAILLLLFLGIRNAWDSVAFHVFRNLMSRDKRKE